MELERNNIWLCKFVSTLNVQLKLWNKSQIFKTVNRRSTHSLRIHFSWLRPGGLNWSPLKIQVVTNYTGIKRIQLTNDTYSNKWLPHLRILFQNCTPHNIHVEGTKITLILELEVATWFTNRLKLTYFLQFSTKNIFYEIFWINIFCAIWIENFLNNFSLP